MSNDFPLAVGRVRIRSSEALYQAMRFPPRPDWQPEVLDDPHAMAAKMKSKKEGRRANGSRPDWEPVQEQVMRWVLRVKLACHPREFGRLLANLRNQLNATSSAVAFLRVEPPAVEDFRLLGRPVGWKGGVSVSAVGRLVVSPSAVVYK